MTACRTDEDAIYVHRQPSAAPTFSCAAPALCRPLLLHSVVRIGTNRCGARALPRCARGRVRVRMQLPARSACRSGCWCSCAGAGRASRARAHCPRAPVRRSAATRLAPSCPAAASCPLWRPPSAHVAAAPRPDDLPCQPPPSPTQPLPPCPLRCPALSAPLSEPTATPSATLNA